MHTYDSDAFLASVLQNLPIPAESGPKTPEGKYIVSQNAVKHGLRLKEGKFLPCKKNCYYKDTCEWHEMIFSESKDKFAGPCPQEVAFHIELEKVVTNEFPDAPEELRQEYIMYTVLINRCNKYNSINPDIRGTHKGLNYVLVIKDLYSQKWLKATEKLQNYNCQDDE